MKTKQIKTVRICLSDKKAALPMPEAINRLHIRWIEQELGKSTYDKETKLKIINRIAENLHAREQNGILQ